MKKKTCTCITEKTKTRFLMFIVFLFTLPLFTFWAGYQVATLGGLVNQMSFVTTCK